MAGSVDTIARMNRLIRATRSHVGWDQETRDRVLTRDSNGGLSLVAAGFILVGLYRRSRWMRWSVWMGPMLAARAIAWRRAIITRWSISPHTSRTFIGIAARTITWR